MKRRMTGFVLAAVSSLMVPMVAAGTSSGADVETLRGGNGFSALVRRASYGVPHITAGNYGGLGFGAGWVQSEDNICIIAESVVTVDGTRARYFGGTGPADENVVSDLFHQKAKDERAAERLLAGRADGVQAPSRKARDLVNGFVAGYNAYLRKVGVNRIPDAACRGKAWVRPITELDAWRVTWASMVRGGQLALLDGIVAAAPPAAVTAPAGAVARPKAAPAQPVPAAAVAKLAARLDEAGGAEGSNAYALGRDVTAHGGGIVLGNPHFPWDGPERFYRMHLTIPGEYDVEGAALIGDPMIEIGHNGKVAWSHTVSTARRFVLRQLWVTPDDPTSYYLDGQVRKMTTRTVTVRVPAPGGGTQPVSKTFYDTVFGPVVILPDGLGWTKDYAFAITDVNATNGRAVDGWLALGKARDVREMRAVLDKYQFLPWVNIIGADAKGQALYADHSVVPRVTDELADACINPLLRPVYDGNGIAILDGTRSACTPGTAPDAAVPGVLGPSELPTLVRTDYVTNSNDSYWLANPQQPLTGFPRVIGDEGKPRSLRTRLGLVQVEERLAGTDGLPGKGFTTENVWDTLFSNRVHGGELMRDDLVRMCTATPAATASDGTSVDLREACQVLQRWDLRADVNSRGTHLFREFVRAGGVRWADAFDPADPVRTPRQLAVADPAVLRSLADAVRRLAGVPLGARLGDVQTEPRGRERIPIHGDRGDTGAFNVITAELVPGQGYPKIQHGTSYVLDVALGAGGPSGRQILTYSQSQNPSSPHSGDQTRLYAREGWDTIKLTRRQLAADPRVRTYTVSDRVR